MTMTAEHGRFRRLGGEGGQALLEMAIFGMAALAALGFLVRVGMKMNYDQEIRMAAFRRALAAAGADNGTTQDAMAVAYHYTLTRQMPNPSDGFMSLPRSRTEASAFVVWGDRLTFAYETDDLNSDAGRETQPLVVVRLNDTVEEHRQNDFELPAGGPGQALQGVLTESETWNTAEGTITQTESTSTLDNNNTNTVTLTKINTRAGDDYISSIQTGGGGYQSW